MYCPVLCCIWRIWCIFFFLFFRGFDKLAVPVWQSSLNSVAVPSELPKCRERCGIGPISSQYNLLLTTPADECETFFTLSGVEMESYSLLVTSAIEMAVVYRSVSSCSKCFCEEMTWYAELSLFHQRCPGIWSVSAHVPLREWSVGRCPLCCGHWPGFWWAQGGAAGNIWAGHSSFFSSTLNVYFKEYTLPGDCGAKLLIASWVFFPFFEIILKEIVTHFWICSQFKTSQSFIIWKICCLDCSIYCSNT